MSWGWMPSSTKESTLALVLAWPMMRRPGMAASRSVA